MDKLKASEIPKDVSTQLHTVWEVAEDANKKEEENIRIKTSFVILCKLHDPPVRIGCKGAEESK